MDIPKPKCYLVVAEEWYEPHKFEYAKVFLNRGDAEDYITYLDKVEKWKPGYEEGFSGSPIIIELDLLLKQSILCQK